MVHADLGQGDCLIGGCNLIDLNQHEFLLLFGRDIVQAFDFDDLHRNTAMIELALDGQDEPEMG